MLLWSSFVWEMDDGLNTDQRTRFINEVLHETMAIEDALTMHNCNLDTGLMYVCQEFIYKSVSFHNLYGLGTNPFQCSQDCDRRAASVRPCCHGRWQCGSKCSSDCKAWKVSFHLDPDSTVVMRMSGVSFPRLFLVLHGPNSVSQ